MEAIQEAYVDRSNFALHDFAMDLFWAYLLVGGMPEAVRDYADTGSLRGVPRIHHSILSQYSGDMTKYADTSKDIIRAQRAWDSVPAQLAKENRKFQYSTIEKGARASRFESSLAWLEAAGIIVKCFQVDSGVVPLSFHENVNAFKVYANDVGLLSTKAEIPPSAVLDERMRASLDRGGIVENYVVQQFVARGIKPRYWTNRNRAEVDLVVEDGSAHAIPVEIKSSDNVRSKSLYAYADKFAPKRLVRFSTKNFGTGKVESIPLYAAGCFAEELVALRTAAYGGA